MTFVKTFTDRPADDLVCPPCGEVIGHAVAIFWDEDTDLAMHVECRASHRHNDASLEIAGECSECGLMYCLDDPAKLLDYSDERGYFHLDGTTCFLHRVFVAVPSR